MSDKQRLDEGKPDSWWYRVYFFVAIFTFAVISLLALFSWCFSK